MPRLDRLVSQTAGLKLPEARLRIERGDVTIVNASGPPDGRVVQSPSWIALLETDTIFLRGRDGPLVLPFLHRLVFMHKPAGVLSERKPGRPNVYDLLPKDVAHSELGSFGRLDRDTTGLLVFGTDGGLCHLATHPGTHLPKVYAAVCRPNLGIAIGAKQIDIDGLVTEDGVYHHSVASAAFERGLVLRDGVLCKPAKLEWDLSGVEPVARVTLSEGKYHQVKRMLAAIGAHVTALRRESVGTLVLSELGIAEGDARAATPEEAKRFCSMFPATPEVRDNPDRAGFCSQPGDVGYSGVSKGTRS